jgi:hypothetical protein
VCDRNGKKPYEQWISNPVSVPVTRPILPLIATVAHFLVSLPAHGGGRDPDPELSMTDSGDQTRDVRHTDVNPGRHLPHGPVALCFQREFGMHGILRQAEPVAPNSVAAAIPRHLRDGINDDALIVRLEDPRGGPFEDVGTLAAAEFNQIKSVSCRNGLPGDHIPRS